MFFANAAVSAQIAASSKIHTIGNLTFFMDRPLLSKPFRAAVPSPHGSRQWLECPQCMGINHMPVYGGRNRSYSSFFV